MHYRLWNSRRQKIVCNCLLGKSVKNNALPDLTSLRGQIILKRIFKFLTNDRKTGFVVIASVFCKLVLRKVDNSENSDHYSKPYNHAHEYSEASSILNSSHVRRVIKSFSFHLSWVLVENVKIQSLIAPQLHFKETLIKIYD